MRDLRQMGGEIIEPHGQCAWRHANVHTVWHRMPGQTKPETAYAAETPTTAGEIQVPTLLQTKVEQH